MLKRLTSFHLYIIAVISGAVLWEGTIIISGVSEAWDSTLYWTAAYPLILAVSGILGYMAPDKPWRRALTLVFIQPVLLILSDSEAGLLPLGLILFGILAIPPVIVSLITSSIHNYRNQS